LFQKVGYRRANLGVGFSYDISVKVWDSIAESSPKSKHKCVYHGSSLL